MQKAELREIEWASPKETLPPLLTIEEPVEEYGPWEWAAAFGRATGRFGAEAFMLQEDGKLRCPAGASLWLSEVRQENAFTEALPSIWPTRPTVSIVLFESSAWLLVRKEIVRVGSALSVASCLRPRWLKMSESLSFSVQCDGWM